MTTDICSKHGPYHTICRECDYEALEEIERQEAEVARRHLDRADRMRRSRKALTALKGQ